MKAMKILNKNDILFSTQDRISLTRTHNLLHKLLATANENMIRHKYGYRYDIDIKIFSTYMRLMSGCHAYDTLQRNLELSLPSLSSTNRYVQKMSDCVVEGQLRINELVRYLKGRNLPLVVSLSEDATRIDGRIQYDSRINQIVGFVSPINRKTGMPIPLSYPARNAEEMFGQFSYENPPAQFVNVVMAQPLANYPPFCLLLYASNAMHLKLKF